MHKYWGPQNKTQSSRLPGIWDLCTTIRKSIPIMYHTSLRVTFPTGNNLRNKLLKYWYEVLKHCQCTYRECLMSRSEEPCSTRHLTHAETSLHSINWYSLFQTQVSKYHYCRFLHSLDCSTNGTTFVRYKVLTVALIHIQVLWDTWPCQLITSNRHFGGACCPCLQSLHTYFSWTAYTLMYE